MTGIPSYSTTPSENVSANTGINWDEGMPPAAVNNSARQNMTDMRLQWNDAAWFAYGVGSKNSVIPVYASGTSVTVAGVDVSAYWHANRRVKAVGTSTGTIYGHVSTVAFSTNTTITFVWDSGSLSNEAITLYAGIIPVTGKPIPSESLGGGTITSKTAKVLCTSGITTNAAYMELTNTGNDSFFGVENSSGGSLITGTSAYATVVANISAYPLQLCTNNAVRATIDSSGRMSVGTASAIANGVFSVLGGTDVTTGVFKNSSASSAEPVAVWNAATSGNSYFVTFSTEGTQTVRGSITYNRGGGLTAYNTTSDYRAKDILGPAEGALDVVNRIKVYRGKMKGAEIERPMFIAHEVQEGGATWAVTGEKDAVKDDGTPLMQQVSEGSLVPMLWAAVQALSAQVEELKKAR